MLDALHACGAAIEIFAGKPNGLCRTQRVPSAAATMASWTSLMIARHKDARNAGSFIAAAANAALLRNSTTQLASYLRLRHARCIEEQCAARQSTAAFEYHCF